MLRCRSLGGCGYRRGPRRRGRLRPKQLALRPVPRARTTSPSSSTVAWGPAFRAYDGGPRCRCPRQHRVRPSPRSASPTRLRARDDSQAVEGGVDASGDNVGRGSCRPLRRCGGFVSLLHIDDTALDASLTRDPNIAKELARLSGENAELRAKLASQVTAPRRAELQLQADTGQPLQGLMQFVHLRHHSVRMVRKPIGMGPSAAERALSGAPTTTGITVAPPSASSRA